MTKCSNRAIFWTVVYIVGFYYIFYLLSIQSEAGVKKTIENRLFQSQLELSEKWRDKNITKLASLPPALYYCNFPDNLEAVTTEEGKGNSNWALKQVQVVIRHGDRSPLNFDVYEAKNIHPTFCNIYNSAITDKSLLGKYRKDVMSYKIPLANNIPGQVRKVFRNTVPKLPVCPPGQLSHFGVLQQLHNGFLLRELYLHKHKLYPEKNLSHKVKVFTTSYSRTYQSASAFLYGLIPNYQLQKIPFHLAKNILFCGFNCHCSFANEVLKKEVDAKKYKIYLERQKRNATIAKLASMLPISDRTGVQMDTLVTGFLCKTFNLPCDESGNCVTQSDLDVVMDEQEHMNKILSGESPQRDQSMLLMQPLLERMSKKMEEVVQDPNVADKIILYSGHDSTLRPLLQALGIPEHRWPRLASRLVFELWQSMDKQHYVRILFNGVDVTSSTSFCSSGSFNGDCPYTKFKEFSSFGIAQHFDVETREQACSSTQQQ